LGKTTWSLIVSDSRLPSTSVTLQLEPPSAENLKVTAHGFRNCRPVQHHSRPPQSNNNNRRRYTHHQRCCCESSIRRQSYDYVTVNETLFQNHYVILKNKPAVSMVAHVNITGHKEQLSLPFLYELSLKNLQHIERLKEEIVTKPLLFSGITLVIVSVYLFVTYQLHRRCVRSRHSKLTAVLKSSLKKSEDGLHWKDRGISMEPKVLQDRMQFLISKPESPSGWGLHWARDGKSAVPSKCRWPKRPSNAAGYAEDGKYMYMYSTSAFYA